MLILVDERRGGNVLEKIRSILNKSNIIFWSFWLLIGFVVLSINHYLSSQNLRSLKNIELNNLQSEEFIVGSVYNNPPFEFIQNGKLVGFEVDLTSEIARRLDLDPNYIFASKEFIITEMREKKYDAIIDGLVITPQETKQLGFSNPYLTTQLCIVIHAPRFNTSHYNLRNKTVAVTHQGSSYETALYLQRHGLIKNIRVYEEKESLNLLQDLHTGKVDASIMNVPTALYFTKQDQGLHILRILPANERLAIGFNTNNVDFIAKVDQVLVEMHKDGSFKKIYEKWFDNNGTLKNDLTSQAKGDFN